MQSNIIQPEKDIYELLLNDSLFELYIDNECYTHYIIYTDNFGYNYKVFIHDNLLYSNIEFFIEAQPDNKLLLLAYKKDLPMIILFEDNDNPTDLYNNYEFVQVGQETSSLSPENNTIEHVNIYEYSEDQIFNYDTVYLTYNNIENAYKDIYGRLYKIYSKENSKINQIIRHYKVIKKKYDWYSENERANHTHRIYFKDGTESNYCLLDINQNPADYQNNLYQDEGFSAHNYHNDNQLYFSKYYSLNEIQDKLKNDAVLGAYSYAHIINSEIYNELDFINEIQDRLLLYETNGYVYIRLAPSLDMRVSAYDRILKINHLYNDIYNHEYNNKLLNADHCEIPIYNDNLIYSNNKYSYIREVFENIDDNINQNYQYYYIGSEEPTEYSNVENWSKTTRKPIRLNIFKENESNESVNWYIAVPLTWNYVTTQYNSTSDELILSVDNWEKRIIKINDIYYDVFEYQILTSTLSVSLTKLENIIGASSSNDTLHWYVGNTMPTSMIDNGWNTINGKPYQIKIYEESENNALWYILIPQSLNFVTTYNGIHTYDWQKTVTIINDVTYDVWTSSDALNSINVTMTNTYKYNSLT